MRPVRPEEWEALGKVRTFSWLAAVGLGLYLVLYVTLFASYDYVLHEESLANSSVLTLTPFLVALALLLTAATVFQWTSLVYLRSGYALLKGSSKRLRAPWAGVSL